MPNRFYKHFLKFLLAIALLSSFVSYTRHVELTNAWNGWSPVGFTWAFEDKHLRDHRDFNHFAFKREHLLNSIANWVYPYAYKYFSIDPFFTQIVFIIVTTFFYSFSIYIFVKTLFVNFYEKTHKVFVTGAFAIILALLTDAINCNFARFGQANLSLAQSYGVAIPLQLCALSMVLRKRLLLTCQILGILIFVHISLGIMTTAVIVAMVLSCSDQWKKPRAFGSIFIITLCGAAWTIYINYGMFESANGIMSLNEWVEWERMMNAHFFPFDLGVFTNLHYQAISPFLSILLVALSSAFVSYIPVTMRKMWLIGLIVSVLITACGLIISLYPPSIKLVMLALHRASGIALLLLLPLAAWHIIDLFYRKDLFSSVLSFSCIMPAFLLKTWGIPVIPALFVATLAFCNKEQPLPNRQRKVLLYLSIITVGNSFFLFTLGYAKPYDASMLGNCYIFVLLLIVILIRIITSRAEIFRSQWERITHSLTHLMYSIFPKLTMTAIIILIGSSIYLNLKKYPTVTMDLARSYLDAQLWANSSTDQKAVFMPDPGVPPYGRAWSEYSRRASFGSVREWLHIPIAYHADMRGFKEGIRRLSLLGIDPYAYKKSAFESSKKNPISEYEKAINDTRIAYFSMSAKELVNLAKREGIAFFIFAKNYLNPPANVVIAYQNNHFVILAPIYENAELYK